MSESGKENNNLKIVNTSEVIEIDDDDDDEDDDVVILGSQSFQNRNNSVTATNLTPSSNHNVNDSSNSNSGSKGNDCINSLAVTNLSQLAASMHQKILEVLCGTGYGLEIHQIMTAMRHFTTWSYRYYDKHTKSLPNCYRLSRNLMTKMNFFHTISKHCNDNEEYLHGMVKLLTLYITVELRLVNDVEQQDQRQICQLANRIVYLLREYLNNPQKDGLNPYVLATLVRLPTMPGGNEIMLKVFQELLTFRQRIVQNAFPDNHYIQYIIVFSKWLKLVPDYRERLRIIEFAEKFMQPCRTLCNNILYAPHLPFYQKHSTATRIILYHLKTLDNLKNASIRDCNTSSFSSDMLTLRDNSGEEGSLKGGANNGHFADLYKIFCKENPKRQQNLMQQIKSNEIIDLTSEESLQAAKCNSIFHNISLEMEEQWLRDFHITSNSLNPLNHKMIFHRNRLESLATQETIELSESDSDSGNDAAAVGQELFSADLPFSDNISDISDSYDDIVDPTLIALRLPCDNLRTYSNKRSTKASTNSNRYNEISRDCLGNLTLKVDKAINTDETAIESPYDDITAMQHIEREDNDNIISKPPDINHTADCDILGNSSAISNINSSDKDMPRIVATFSCRRDSIHILSSPVYGSENDDSSLANINADTTEQEKLNDDCSLNYFLKKLQNVSSPIDAVTQNLRTKGKFNETNGRKSQKAEQFNVPRLEDKASKAAYRSVKYPLKTHMYRNQKPIALKNRTNSHNRFFPLSFPLSSGRVPPSVAGSTSTSVSTSTSSSINLETLKELAQQEHIAAAPAVFRSYSFLPLQMDAQLKSKYNHSTYPLNNTMPHLSSYTSSYTSSNQRNLIRAKATKSTARKSNVIAQRRSMLNKADSRAIQEKGSIASKSYSSGYHQISDNKGDILSNVKDNNISSSGCTQQLLNDPKLKCICKIIIEKSSEMQEYLRRQQQQRQRQEEEEFLQTSLPEKPEELILSAKDTLHQSYEEKEEEKQLDGEADNIVMNNIPDIREKMVNKPADGEHLENEISDKRAFANRDKMENVQEIEETEQSFSCNQLPSSPSELPEKTESTVSLPNPPITCPPTEMLLLPKSDAETVSKTTASIYTEEMPNDPSTLTTFVDSGELIRDKNCHNVNEKFTGTELNSTDIELISDLADLLPTMESNGNHSEIPEVEVPTTKEEQHAKELGPLFDSFQNAPVPEAADSGLMKATSNPDNHTHQLNNCDTIVPFLGNLIPPVINLLDKVIADLESKGEKETEQNANMPSNEDLQNITSTTTRNDGNLAIQKSSEADDLESPLDVTADMQATKAFRIRVKRTKLLKAQPANVSSAGKLHSNPKSNNIMPPKMKSILKKPSTQSKSNQKVRFEDEVFNKNCIKGATANSNKLNANPNPKSKDRYPKDSQSTPYKPIRCIPGEMPLIKRPNFKKSKENTLKANDTLMLFHNNKLGMHSIANCGHHKANADSRKPTSANMSKTQMLKSVLAFRENICHPVKLSSAKEANSTTSSTKDMLKTFEDDYSVQPMLSIAKISEHTPSDHTVKKRRKRKKELRNGSLTSPSTSSTIKNNNNNNNSNISNKVQQCRQNVTSNKNNVNDYLVTGDMEAGVVNEVDVFSEQLLPMPEVNESLLGSISNERSSIGSASSLRDEYMCIEATDTVPANIFNDESRDAAPTPSILLNNNTNNSTILSNSNPATTSIANPINHSNEHYTFIPNYDYEIPTAGSTVLEKLNTTTQQMGTSSNISSTTNGSSIANSKYMDTASVTKLNTNSLNTLTSTPFNKNNELNMKYNNGNASANANYPNDAKSEKLNPFNYTKFHNELKLSTKHPSDSDSLKFLKGLGNINQKDPARESKEDDCSKNTCFTSTTAIQNSTNSVKICSSTKSNCNGGRKRKHQDPSLQPNVSNSKMRKKTTTSKGDLKSDVQLSGKHSKPSFTVNIPIGKIVSPKYSTMPPVTKAPNSIVEKTPRPIKKSKEGNINNKMQGKIKKQSAKDSSIKEIQNKKNLKSNIPADVRLDVFNHSYKTAANLITANKPQKKHNCDNKLRIAVKASIHSKTNTTNSLTNSDSTNSSKLPNSSYRNCGKVNGSIMKTQQQQYPITAMDAMPLRLSKKQKSYIDKPNDNTKSQHISSLISASNLSTKKTTTNNLIPSIAEQKIDGIAIKRHWTAANTSLTPALVPTTLLSPLSVYSSSSPLSSLMSSPSSFSSSSSTTSISPAVATANIIASNFNNKLMRKPSIRTTTTTTEAASAAATVVAMTTPAPTTATIGLAVSAAKTRSLDTTPATTTTALSSLILSPAVPSPLTTLPIQNLRKPTTFQLNKKPYYKNNNNHISSNNNHNNNNNNTYNNNHNHHHHINNNNSSCNSYN